MPVELPIEDSPRPLIWTCVFVFGRFNLLIQEEVTKLSVAALSSKTLHFRNWWRLSLTNTVAVDISGRGSFGLMPVSQSEDSPILLSSTWVWNILAGFSESPWTEPKCKRVLWGLLHLRHREEFWQSLLKCPLLKQLVHNLSFFTTSDLSSTDMAPNFLQ